METVKDPRLEAKKKAREAARKEREKKYNNYSDQMISFGKKIEETKEGSPEEKSLMNRKNKWERAYNRSNK